MAGSTVVRHSGVSNDNYGFEIYSCAVTTPTITFTITPVLLESITMVTLTPMDAAAATADTGYVTSFVNDSPTVVATVTTDSEWLVKIEGKVA